MKSIHPSSDHSAVSNPLRSFERILLRGVHLEIAPSLRAAALEKGARLLRHEPDLIRLRIDVEHHSTKGGRAGFVAMGRIEISGPDLVAKVTGDSDHQAVALLIDRLDLMLRERTRARADRRNNRAAGTEFRDLLAAEVRP